MIHIPKAQPLHLFIVVVLAIGAILFWNYTSALEKRNNIELERIAAQERMKAAEIQQEEASLQAERQQEAARKNGLDSCINDATSTYRTSWNSACIKLSVADECFKDCVNVNRREHGYSEEKLATQCRIFCPAIPRQECDLPASTADYLNSSWKDAQDTCLDRYSK